MTSMSDLMLQNTFFRLKKVALPVQVDCFIEYKSTKTRLNKRIYEIREILLVYEYALPCLGISILGELNMYLYVQTQHYLQYMGKLA